MVMLRNNVKQIQIFATSVLNYSIQKIVLLENSVAKKCNYKNLIVKNDFFLIVIKNLEVVLTQRKEL